MSYSDQLRDYGLMIELDGESLLVSPTELVTREVADLIRAHKQVIVAELAGASQWSGGAAALVKWFKVNRHNLPLEPFILKYYPDGEAMFVAGAPADHYRQVEAAIEEGPTGLNSQGLISFLSQLKVRFDVMEDTNDATD